MRGMQRQQGAKQVNSGLRDVGKLGIGNNKVGIGIDDSALKVGNSFGSERESTGKHSEQHDTACPHIGLLWYIRGLLHDFRGCVLRGTAMLTGDLVAARTSPIAHTEIRELELAIGAHEDILRLDVAMTYAALVQILQGGKNLAHQFESVTLMQCGRLCL